MKNTLNIVFTLYIVMLVITSGCIKDISDDTIIGGPNYEPTEIITASLYGSITDSQGNPVSDATVHIVNSHLSDVNTVTDENGYYQFVEVQIKGNTATFGIDAVDMFKLEHHVSISNNKLTNADFQLAPFVKSGEFSASQGGQITQGNLATLDFKPNSIADASGLPYNGSVEVFINLIDPFNKSIDQRAYGGNIGENEALERFSKYSYQSIQVELQTPQGDLLNIKNGSTVKIQVNMQDNIPGGAINKELTMMSYDESLNIWKVEGTGMAENGFYTAELPHFSTWTWCEIFSNPVNLYGTINLLNQGIPYNGKTYVIIDYGTIAFKEIPSDDGSFFFTYGLAQEPFTFSVLDECEVELYSDDFASVANNTNLGSFDFETPPNYTNELRATVYDCDGNLVENGYSRLCIPELAFTRCKYLPIEEGQIAYDFLSCNQPLIGKLFILDTDNLLTTEPLQINLENQDVDINYISLCDTFKNNITVNVGGNFVFSHYRIGYIGFGPPANGIDAFTDFSEFTRLYTTTAIDGIGTYELRKFTVVNSDSTIYIDQSNPSVTLEIEEFIPNSSNPNNHYLIPEHLKATFSGEAEQMDYNTGSVIGTVEVSGSILID